MDLYIDGEYQNVNFAKFYLNRKHNLYKKFFGIDDKEYVGVKDRMKNEANVIFSVLAEHEPQLRLELLDKHLIIDFSASGKRELSSVLNDWAHRSRYKKYKKLLRWFPLLQDCFFNIEENTLKYRSKPEKRRKQRIRFSASREDLDRILGGIRPTASPVDESQELQATLLDEFEIGMREIENQATEPQVTRVDPIAPEPNSSEARINAVHNSLWNGVWTTPTTITITTNSTVSSTNTNPF